MREKMNTKQMSKEQMNDEVFTSLRGTKQSEAMH